MSRPALWLLVALLAAPAGGYFVYRLAKALGFLDPPVDRQHELRRAILVSLYCFLLFLPVFLYGFGSGWPRAWIIFGIFVALALVFFAAGGLWAAVQLWRIRHTEAMQSSAATSLQSNHQIDPPLSRNDEAPEELL
jgi:hypothetical protein